MVLSFEIYSRMCYVLPTFVRSWFGSLDGRFSTAVDRFTSRYVSSGYIAKELSNLQLETSSLEALGMNLRVKTSNQMKNVNAIYSLDDVIIELNITFPENAPLGKIATEHNRVTSIQQNCQAWTLQLVKLLNYNNGTLREGLTKWHKNLDRHFDDFSCMICFSLVLNYQGTKYLPQIQCKTCRKKYHSNCLNTWFKTSQKYECPLCRSAFM
ncbi:hypothetical protein HELRODRAFT_82884 [Helobdella robusta]|uniref:E3 ubiquitin-protein ligase listerin n=1 Tax=Helobdella robusta TaxID=6412 RepID=T1G4X8_HELRO|nr:hypothetical protein HELRODRAFT_82884 [Helobdella robusta]ESO00567.1 hypothetical protein HELRODRAFT_82884 [Helobdella robusta]